MKPRIHYIEVNYKYELTENYLLNIGHTIPEDIKTEYIVLNTNGLLFIKRKYHWDGPSGPTVDTASFMRGSLVHDALYQLIREDELCSKFRKKADKLLYKLCREDGMSWFRANYVYYAVREFGGSHTKGRS